MALDPLTAGLNILDKVIGSVFPDKAQQEAAKLKLLEMQINGELQELTARSQIISQEAKSEHWLVATWRPLTMLIFVSLIVARWFGWAAPDLSEAEYLKLWDIVQIGLNGYVIGRSVEKITPTIATALVSRKTS